MQVHEPVSTQNVFKCCTSFSVVVHYHICRTNWFILPHLLHMLGRFLCWNVGCILPYIRLECSKTAGIRYPAQTNSRYLWYRELLGGMYIYVSNLMWWWISFTGHLGIFFFFYYGCLTGFFAVMLAVFYHTLDDTRPKLLGSNSLFDSSPGTRVHSACACSFLFLFTVEISIFFVIYYTSLAALFASMLAVFYPTLDWNEPKLKGSDMLLKQTPGLYFQVIHFVICKMILHRSQFCKVSCTRV